MSIYLTNGASSHRGIYLAGSNGSVSQASYAYRVDGRITCETGAPKELGALFKKHRVADSIDGNSGLGRVALMIIIPIALIAAAALFGQNGFQVAGVTVFAVLAAFPCYTLSLIGENDLPSDELFQQLRRHHGAEHTLFDYTRKNSKRKDADLTPQDLQGYSYLDRECGTVWMATLVIWTAALGLAISFVPTWGAAGALKLMGVVTVLLLLNTYMNPANPLLIIQKSEVAPPTLAEFEVAVVAYNTLRSALGQEETA